MSQEENIKINRMLIALSVKIDNMELSYRNWLTPMQLANYLGLSVNTVYQYVSNQKIPFHKIPKSSKLIFNRREIDNWIGGKEIDDSHTPKEIVDEIWESVK